jgi:hypothetical protein
LGAEKLLGRGDMLFTTSELSKPKRIQGAYVGDAEISKICRHIKDQLGTAEYLEGITEKQKVKGMAGVGLDAGGGDDDEDSLLGEAKEIIVNMGKASASLLQRRLSIGYARAARILDLLEEQGVVGPANGAKPREILITKEQYEAMIDQQVSGVSLHNRDEAVAPDEYLPADDDEEEVDEEEEGEDSDGADGESSEDEEDQEESDDEEEEEEKEGDDVDDGEDDSEEIEKKKGKASSRKPGKAEEVRDKSVKRLLDEDPFGKFFSK